MPQNAVIVFFGLQVATITKKWAREAFSQKPYYIQYIYYYYILYPIILYLFDWNLIKLDSNPKIIGFHQIRLKKIDSNSIFFYWYRFHNLKINSILISRESISSQKKNWLQLCNNCLLESATIRAKPLIFATITKNIATISLSAYLNTSPNMVRSLSYQKRDWSGHFYQLFYWYDMIHH